MLEIVSNFTASLYNSACSTNVSSRAAGGRIAYGNFAADAQFPYIAHIKVKVDGRFVICGGTLIAPRVVLTAGTLPEK